MPTLMRTVALGFATLAGLQSGLAVAVRKIETAIRSFTRRQFRCGRIHWA